MATTDSGADAPSSPAALSSADDDKSCFICLQTATETPDAVWVTPCPCSMDAHEECLLQWIAEMEAIGGATTAAPNGRIGRSSPKKIRCPVCNARIRTIDPRDRLVDLGDRMLAAYKHFTPVMLGSIVSAMGVAGSSFYGFQSLSVFAGGAEAGEWLLRGMPDMVVGNNFDSLIDMAAGVTTVGNVTGLLGGHARWVFRVVNKVILLNLLAPSLLLHRVLPSVTNLVALPASLIYGFVLASRGKMPTWPPSPAWAMVAMPTVSIAYATAYYDLFGGLEKRLDRAVRGRPEQDEPQELRAPVAIGGGGGGANGGAGNNAEANNANNAVAAQDAEGEGGILARLGRLRVLLAALAGQDDEHDHVHGDGEEEFLPDNVGDIALQVNNEDGFIQVAVDIAIEEIVEEEEEVDTDEEDDDNAAIIHNAANIDDDEILPPRLVRDDDMNILGDVGVGGRGVEGNDDNNDDAALPPPDIRRLRPEAAAAAGLDMDAEIAAAVAGADNHGINEHGPAHLHADVMDGPALAEAMAAAPPPPAAAAAAPPANNGGGLFLSDIIAAVTSQLLLPQVAATIGNLLFVTLPRSWVVPPAPEVPVAVAAVSWWSLSTKTITAAPPRLPTGTVRRGLLMEKWGRSLVGGLLWIVLRDAWSLYIKYRRVQMMKQRKIKNVDRKKRRGEETA